MGAKIRIEIFAMQVPTMASSTDASSIGFSTVLCLLTQVVYLRSYLRRDPPHNNIISMVGISLATKRT